MTFKNGLPAIFLTILVCLLGYLIPRDVFWAVFLAWLGIFGFGYLIVKYNPGSSFPVWLGIFLRAILLFSIPALSDDFYRFLWDGRLIANGIHPFAFTPEQIMEMSNLPPGISDSLFFRLNSAEYFTVYPPVSQLVFALSVLLFPGKVLGSVFVIKFFLFLCEVGSIFLLRGLESQTGRFKNAAALYALNPLAILEVTGNCHFEGAVVFFVLYAIYFLQSKKWLAGAWCWALGIASKMLPLLFIPLVWKWLGLRKGFLFATATGICTVLLFLPLLNPGILNNMAESLDLYFQQFYFNGSFYYLAKFSLESFGISNVYKILGLALTPVTLFVLGFQLVRLDPKPKGTLALETAMLWTSFAYLSVSATVHPWYILIPFVFSLGTSYRFAWAWTATAVLSYSHYKGGGFKEDFFLIFIEYLIVWIVLIYEFRRELKR